MENNLLIWEQDYDVVSHNCVVKKSDLEEFIQERITKFLEKTNTSGHITYTYISHNVKEVEGYVTILFKHDGYKIESNYFPAGDYHDSFYFFELNKIPFWVRKSKVYSIDAEDELIKIFNEQMNQSYKKDSL